MKKRYGWQEADVAHLSTAPLKRKTPEPSGVAPTAPAAQPPPSKQPRIEEQPAAAAAEPVSCDAAQGGQPNGEPEPAGASVAAAEQVDVGDVAAAAVRRKETEVSAARAATAEASH
jgi:hypothetical protein